MGNTHKHMTDHTEAYRLANGHHIAMLHQCTRHGIIELVALVITIQFFFVETLGLNVNQDTG
jgi:hypothetical protein